MQERHIHIRKKKNLIELTDLPPSPTPLKPFQVIFNFEMFAYLNTEILFDLFMSIFKYVYGESMHTLYLFYMCMCLSKWNLWNT